LVIAGTKLHDKREYAAALQKYQEALVLWPQDAFAHYEMGLSLMTKEIVAKGQKPPPPDRIFLTIRIKKKSSPKVEAAFAKARRHDPFRFRAYQGTDKDVLRGFVSLLKKGLPIWNKLLKNRKQQLDDDALIQLASACQDAGNHELALSIRQIIVARRKGFDPEDHPFISKSLRELAPGKKTEKVLVRLAGDEKLRLRQLIIPENDAP
jgi:tetratricopeptide (TPR) repeat protein